MAEISEIDVIAPFLNINSTPLCSKSFDILPKSTLIFPLVSNIYLSAFLLPKNEESSVSRLLLFSIKCIVFTSILSPAYCFRASNLSTAFTVP